MTEMICPDAGKSTNCRRTFQDGSQYICHHAESHEKTAGCVMCCPSGGRCAEKVNIAEEAEFAANQHPVFRDMGKWDDKAETSLI